MRRIVALLATTALVLAACATGGGDGTGTTAATTGESMNIDGFAFVPDEITVAAGTTVTWTNLDGVAHTVTSDDDVFDSGSVESDGTFSFTFAEPGTYTYFCRIHPSMTATVIVE